MSKWTLDSTNPAGPIQVGKFNKAIRSLTNEHNHMREKWGAKSYVDKASGEDYGYCKNCI